MIAKLRILSSSSIADSGPVPATRGAPRRRAASSTPSQLVAPDLEITVRGADQRDGAAPLANHHPVARAQRDPFLSVHGEHRVMIGRLDPHLQRAGVGQHYR